MSLAVGFLFTLITAGALAFVAWPLWRRSEPRGRLLLVAATVVLFLGVGAGTYLIVGRPALAVRSLEGADTRDLNGLIALLARRMRENPNDPRGWAYLGRAYL